MRSPIWHCKDWQKAEDHRSNSDPAKWLIEVNALGLNEVQQILCQGARPDCAQKRTVVNALTGFASVGGQETNLPGERVVLIIEDYPAMCASLMRRFRTCIRQ
jgi:hypothetical protein